MRWFFLLAGMAIVMGASSQVSIGHRIGVAWSKWEADGADREFADEYNAAQHFLLGAVLDIPVDLRLLKYARISSGLTFIQKGTSYEDKGNFYRHNYLQVPLCAGAEFSLRRFAISAQIGLAYGEYVRGQYHYDYSGTTPPGVALLGREDEQAYILTSPTSEWSGLGRLNLTYHRLRSRFELALGYQHGLNNVMYGNVSFVDAEGDPAPHLNAFQRSYTLQFGYSMELTGRARSRTHDQLDSLMPEIGSPEREPRVRIGQRFGGTSSAIEFHGSSEEENLRINDGAERLVALASAIVVNIRLGDHLSLQPELAYTQKGWLCQWYPRPTTENDVLRMNYSELPVLFRYAVGSARLRPFVLAGPVVSAGLGGVDRYGVAGTWNGGYSAAVAVTFGEDNRQSDYAPIDFSGLIAVGLCMRSGKGEVFVDLRYQHSFIDFIPETNNYLYSESAQAYHRNWLLNIGYLVPWRK